MRNWGTKGSTYWRAQSKSWNLDQGGLVSLWPPSLPHPQTWWNWIKTQWGDLLDLLQGKPVNLYQAHLEKHWGSLGNHQRALRWLMEGREEVGLEKDDMYLKRQWTHRGFIRAVKIHCSILSWWIHVIIPLSKPQNGLWVLMIRQCRLIACNKSPSLVGSAGNRRLGMCWAGDL